MTHFYPGQLRSFKRPGYLEVRRKKSRFFLATNLGWRSANAISLKQCMFLASHFKKRQVLISKASNKIKRLLFI